MTLPNLITFLRIFLIPLFILFLLIPDIYAAVILFVVLAFSDLLDGFLARYLGQTSDLGKFLDPLADKILVLSGLTALVQLGKVSAVPVIIILVRELAVMGLRTSVAKSGTVIAASNLGKWKTASQLLAIFWLILGLAYAQWVLWLSVALTVVSGIEYFVTWTRQ